MTTLPQTTPLRLPRPSQQTTALAVAPPQVHAGMVGYGQTPVAGMTGSDVWRVIRSNFWLIILMIMVGAAAGYGINWWLLKNHPRYTAEGKVLVSAPMVFSATDPFGQEQLDPNVLALEVRTHASVLQHDPALISRVLENPDSEARNSAWFKSYSTIQEAKQDLTDRLDVTFAPDSRLIEVSMTDSDAKSCQVIVQSIVDEYIKEQQVKDQNREYNRHGQLDAQRIVVQRNITLLGTDISELEAELNEKGITGVMNHVDSKSSELQSQFNELTDLRSKEATMEGEYGVILSEINADQDPDEVLEKINNDPTVQKYQNIVSNLEEAMLDVDSGQDSAPGQQNPSIVKAQNMLTKARAKLDETMASKRVEARNAVLETKKSGMEALQKQIQLIQTNIASLQSDMALLTDKETQLNQKLNEKDDDEKKLKELNDNIDQLDNMDAKADFSGVEWEERPELPDIPSFPRLQIVMPFSIAVGLVLALGIAFLREWMDTSIRSPRDISRVGSMNLLGMVPHEDDDPQSAGARLPVVIFEAPHSMMAEQLRQVRTRLQHGSSLDTTRSILVSSPSPGDGKSTMACNIAAGLALNGRRILLVDANFRRPELHRIFNLQNNQGFADVLNSLDLFEHSVQETQVPNLYVLPSGPKPSNATELIESQLMVDFIERVLEEFDHVIFDSGPLLFVSETVALAPRVDGVVTVVRARANTRGVLTRTRDTLRQVKAEHLGVILNAVRAQGGGYYGRNIRTYYEYQNGEGEHAA